MMIVNGKIVFLFFFLIALGNGQKVDLLKHKDLILKLHNGYRAIQRSSNMKKLKWSDKLAKEAETWVGRCWYQFKAGADGENMFFFESALSDNILIERAIDTWYGEKYNWRRGGDCTDACSYTQMVWAKTDEVGCAAHRCSKLNLVEEFIPNGWFITCLYNPKGNTLGKLPFESGNPCTLCDMGERCLDNLCVPNTPAKHRVSVQNRAPPRPKIKPILSFDDVQRRGPGEFLSDTQNRQNWMNPGPAMPSLRDSFGRRKQRPRVLGIFRPTEPVPKFSSINEPSTKKLIMTESAFGLETFVQEESKQPVNNSLDGSETVSEDPTQINSAYDDATKLKNISDDAVAPRKISPVYAQMTMNGPVFSFRGTLFKSHLSDKSHEKPQKTTFKEIITTSTTTTTTTTTEPTTTTRQIPKWFELKVNQADDQRINKKSETHEQFQNMDKTESTNNGLKTIVWQKQIRSKEENKIPSGRNQERGDIPTQRKQPSAVGTVGGSNARFVFMTRDTNGRRKRTEEMSGVTEQPAKSNTSPTEADSFKGNNFNKAVPTPPPNPLPCPDSDANCKHWKKYCGNNKHVMYNCQGTCNTCPTPPPPPTTVPTPPPCPDLDNNCHLWKAHCRHNDYVREHCFNSCNNCTHATYATPTPYPLLPEQTTSSYVGTTRISSGTSTSSPQKNPCVDSDQYCPGWTNLCHTDEYVKINCRKSCVFCK